MSNCPPKPVVKCNPCRVCISPCIIRYVQCMTKDGGCDCEIKTADDVNKVIDKYLDEHAEDFNKFIEKYLSENPIPDFQKDTINQWIADYLKNNPIESNSKGLQMYLGGLTKPSVDVEYLKPVMFDQTVPNADTNFVTYNDDGTFTINESGRYRIDWLVNFMAAMPNPGYVAFAIKVNDEYAVPSTSHGSESTISGFANILLKAGDKISLINETKDATVILRQNSAQADISILKV